ncbi:MAG: glutathione S-transferase C-terminal domain-containing protein, partial [Pseudomonadota bacterium]
IIACDIHPLNNLSVLADLKTRFGAGSDQTGDWYRHWIEVGFRSLEALAQGCEGAFLFGDTPTLAEICLVPQVYNARRFDMDLSAFPRLVEIDAKCQELEAFKAAAPEAQPDAPA